MCVAVCFIEFILLELEDIHRAPHHHHLSSLSDLSNKLFLHMARHLELWSDQTALDSDGAHAHYSKWGMPHCDSQC